MEHQQKKKQTFKEYYSSNPEFQQKHRDYVRQKIVCPDCNKEVSRSNLSAHKRAKKHAKYMNKNVQQNTDSDLKKEIDQLKSKIESLESLINCN